MRRALLLAFALVLASRPALASSPPGSIRVLLLHSHYQGYSWTDGITRGVMSTLAASGRQIDLSVAYLDSRRTMDKDYDAAFTRYLESRFRGMGFSLVMTADNEALQYVAEHRKGVLSGVPVVFCGVNDFIPGLISGIQDVTGVAEEVDMMPTVLAALKLWPGTRKISVFECDNPTALALEAQFRRDVESALDDRLGFEYHRGLSLEEMTGIARTLPADGIVVLLNITRDSRGNTIDPAKAAASISQASHAPVFSFWDFGLGQGIVGGRITSGMVQGEDAATLALRILGGEKASSIAVSRGHSSPFVFDWRALRRFHLDPAFLPPHSEVINRPASIWQRHATVLIVSGSIILTLIAFVTILLFLFSRMRRAQKELKRGEAALIHSLEEKETLLREVNHRVKNNLQVMASLLRLGSTMSSGGVDLVNASRMRIEAMAIVHEELYDSQDFNSLDFASLIKKIVERLQACWPLPGVSIDLPGKGRAGVLALDTALPLCLIIDEVVSNCLRHGFPGGRTGHIGVSVRTEEGGAWRLEVEDDGIGHPQGFDLHRVSSAGYQVVNALSQQLDASLSLESGPEGSRVVLLFPR